MTRLSGVPDGFAVVRSPGATLIAAASLIESLTRLGLHVPAGWRRITDAAAEGSGRGPAGTLEVAGRSLILKQMRRGGRAGWMWRQRYPGSRRLLDNLTVPLAVARRGIATAEPVALLLVPGPPGLYRGWLATRRILGAEDLARRFASSTPPDAAQLRVVLSLVRRMHDAGIEHPDLNLGNLLLRAAAGGPEAFVIDLDRVRLHDRPLSFRARLSAVRRLERSFVKQFGERAGAPDWYALYATEQPELELGFRRGRPVGRLLQRLHRLGWRG